MSDRLCDRRSCGCCAQLNCSTARIANGLGGRRWGALHERSNRAADIRFGAHQVLFDWAMGTVTAWATALVRKKGASRWLATWPGKAQTWMQDRMLSPTAPPLESTERCEAPRGEGARGIIPAYGSADFAVCATVTLMSSPALRGWRAKIPSCASTGRLSPASSV